MAMATNTELLDSLVTLLAEKMQDRTKATGFPSGTPSTPYMHGPGGLFGVPGIERDLISTRIMPRGLASILPGTGSVDMYPFFGYVTGFQSTTGVVAAGVCDDPETAGAIKACLQTAQFGRYSYQTREMELNRVGQRINRGEFLDLRLINDPLLTGMGNIIQPDVPGSLDLNREMLVRMMEVGVSFQNKLAIQIYEGNPANNTAAGGYKEFPGLDILISTNHYDAVTGVSCPTLASDIKDFGYGLVSGTTPSIVTYLTYMMRILRDTASRTNMDPVRWVLAMRQTLFWELTAVWPCSYLTYMCTMSDATVDRLVVNATDQVAMRDDMRTNSYLLIDGMRFDVILDDGITEETNTTNANVPSGQFSSDIYVIPLTVRGGLATTYWQYLDYSQGAMIGAADGNYTPYDFWTDGGRYLWHKKPPVNWCVQLLAKIEPRLIFLTPHLAGRLQNIRYAPLQHERDPFPTNPYYVDGGVTTGYPFTQPYSQWNLP